MTTVRVQIKNDTNSGNRKGWTKLVTAVDMSKNDGYAFTGTFLNDQEYDLPVGGVLVQKNPEGSVKNGWSAGVCLVVEADGTFRRVHDETYNWTKNFLSFRDLVAQTIEAQKRIEDEANMDAMQARIDSVHGDLKSLVNKYGFDTVRTAAAIVLGENAQR